MHTAARLPSLPRAVIGIAVVTALLLLVPAIAMQFTDEVRWGPGDFVVAAGLLSTAGLAMVFGSRALRGTLARAAFIAAVVAVLALVWAELAVGLFR